MNFLQKLSKKWGIAKILTGSFLVAAGVKWILDPMSLATGGVSGLAVIVKHYTDIPLWVSSTAFNIPLFILAIRSKGVKFFAKTILATIGVSFFLAVLPDIVLVSDDIFLGAVFGGVLNGLGIGLVLSAMATTGGTDLLAALIQKHMPHYTVAGILQFVDGAIVLLGAFVFGIDRALYAIVSVYLVSKISDGLIEGTKFAKQAYIISDKYEEISRALLEFDSGVTGIHAKGMYSDEDKMLLYCVVHKKEIVGVKDIVYAIDPNAFVIVSDAREVLGEGFIDNRQ